MDKMNKLLYEQYLSPFGKTVLHTLIKQWDKAKQTKNEYQNRKVPGAQFKRVINFNSDTIISAPFMPTIIPTHGEQMWLGDLAEQSSNNITDDIVLEIPKSEELIQTLQKNNDKDNFLHPAVVPQNLVFDIYNVDSDNENTINEVNIDKNTKVTKSKDIHWDDMLDSELFVDMVINEEKNENLALPNENVNVANGTNIDNDKFENKCKKRKSKKPADPKIKKVCGESNTVKNQCKPIKLVKPDNKIVTDKPKDVLRKQKYTKTVQNWLDNVEAHRPNGEEIFDCNAGNGIETHTFEKRQKIDHKSNFNDIILNNKENIVVDKTVKTVKKVIQAQLANKNGVMKYSNPKNIITEIDADKENKSKNNVKEKKLKKFVPPIKSQIPIKDVTFEIYTINENSIENYEDKLCEVINTEIIAILLYSNGFSQLNSQHTDSTCVSDGVVVNNDDIFYYFTGTGHKIKETLKRILENNKVVCYGARDILIYLSSRLQIDLNSITMYDAKIGASLLDPDNPPENFTDLQKLLSFTPHYTIATECTLQKSAWYTSLLKECWAKLHVMLVDDSLWKIFVDIEMKLVPIIADMEQRGVTIDLAKLKSMEEVLLSRMMLVEQQCYKAAGKMFQINSAVQVRAILYDELQLDTKCNVKIRETISKGAKSTSETMLRSLMSKHPLPKLILEYRHLHKAHATFVTGIAQHVKDSVVRPSWVQTAAATGRIASNNPNLQAIPKAPFSLIMFPEANDNDNERLIFRSLYVPRAGHSFVAADFKHIECRVFAHAAADTSLLHALAADLDLFKVLAAKWLNKPESEVSVEERERTKRLVYASLYGAGTRKLMEILDVSYQQALQVAASFNRTFPSLKSFGAGVVSQCARAGGRLATLCGRVRRFNNIVSDDFALKSHAERQAVNFIVQGSAADLCKIAMILTEERLRDSSPALEARLVLQIHDELVWEVRDPHVDKAAGIIKQVMEGCGQQCGMTVTLPVTVTVGKSWGHMQDYTAHHT